MSLRQNVTASNTCAPNAYYTTIGVDLTRLTVLIVNARKTAAIMKIMK